MGERKIKLSSFDTSKLSARQKWFLATAIASRTAYQMAVIHEISQWHGFVSVPLFSEEVSAYSPEDLYSNMLGAKLASIIIKQNMIYSNSVFNTNMTTWLDEVISDLEPLVKSNTDKVFKRIDGKWWDRSKRLPSKYLVLKRNYNLSDTMTPLLVEDNKWELSKDLLVPKLEKVTLHMPKNYLGFDLDKIARISFTIDKKYYSKFKHIPEKYWKNKQVDYRLMQIIARYDMQYDEREKKQLKEK